MPDVTTQAPEPSLTALPEPSVRLGVTLANAVLAASAIAQPSVSPNEEIFIFGTPKRIWMVVFCLLFSLRLTPKSARSIIQKGGWGPQQKGGLSATVIAVGLFFPHKDRTTRRAEKCPPHPLESG